MKRLLLLLLMVAFAMGQGSSPALAICQHKDAQAHAAARASHDSRIAEAAFVEEAAAAVAAKKGAAGTSSMAGAIDMLAPPAPAIATRVSVPMRVSIAAAPPLGGTSLRPLLQPPSA